MKKHMAQAGRGRRGFTLIELALVLLLVTVLISAIFIAGERVWDNYAVYRVMQEVMTTVQNVRANYSNTIPAWPASAEQTNTFYTQGLMPAEMSRPVAAPPAMYDHALNNNYATGSFHIYSVPNATAPNPPPPVPINAFRIVLFGITYEDCIKLLMMAPLSDGSIGIIQVGTGGGASCNAAGCPKLLPPATSAVIYNGATAVGGQAYIMTLATAAGTPPAAGWCTPPGLATTVDVEFDFKLVN